MVRAHSGRTFFPRLSKNPAGHFGPSGRVRGRFHFRKWEPELFSVVGMNAREAKTVPARAPASSVPARAPASSVPARALASSVPA